MGIKYTSTVTSWTPTATAEGAQLTASGYHALRSATANADFCRIPAVYIGGESASSTVNAMGLRRHTTASSTPTNRVPAVTNPSSQASIFQGFITASTNPTPAALATIQHVHNFTLNTYGDIVNWHAGADEEIWFYGTATNWNEISLSTVTGAGVVSTSITVEEM